MVIGCFSKYIGFQLSTLHRDEPQPSCPIACKQNQFHLDWLAAFRVRPTRTPFSRFMRTQIGVVAFAELSPSTKTEIKWQLVRLAQLASILNGHESILCVVISDKPVVVPVTDKKTISLC